MAPEVVKVKQYSFCPECKGRGCKKCRGSGKIVTKVDLEQIQKPFQWEYQGFQKGKRRRMWHE